MADEEDPEETDGEEPADAADEEPAEETPDEAEADADEAAEEADADEAAEAEEEPEEDETAETEAEAEEEPEAEEADSEEAEEEAEEEEPDHPIQLGDGESVEGVPLAQVSARLMWGMEQSQVRRREGDTVIRTPDGPRELGDVLDEIDLLYFEKRQEFEDAVHEVIGTGPIPTE